MGQPFGDIIMVGRPAPRVFRVIQGGVLDLRFVTMHFGVPEIVTPILVVGTGRAVLIEGGQGE